MSDFVLVFPCKHQIIYITWKKIEIYFLEENEEKNYYVLFEKTKLFLWKQRRCACSCIKISRIWKQWNWWRKTDEIYMTMWNVNELKVNKCLFLIKLTNTRKISILNSISAFNESFQEINFYVWAKITYMKLQFFTFLSCWSESFEISHRNFSMVFCDLFLFIRMKIAKNFDMILVKGQRQFYWKKNFSH